MFGSITGPAAFVGMVVLMLIAVPQIYIKRFIWMGIIGGFVLAILILSIMQNLLGFWQFLNIDLVYLSNIPISLSAVWMPLVIMFSYFLNTGINNITRIVAMIAIFASIPVIGHWFLLSQGLLVYRDWSLTYTFILASAIHIMLYFYLNLASQAKQLR